MAECEKIISLGHVSFLRVCPRAFVLYHLLNETSILSIYMFFIWMMTIDILNASIYVVDIQLWIRSYVTSIYCDQVHINSDKKLPMYVFTFEPLFFLGFHDMIMINEDGLICLTILGFSIKFEGKWLELKKIILTSEVIQT